MHETPPPPDAAANPLKALRRPPSTAFLDEFPALSAEAKRARVAANLAALEEDLWSERLVFRSRPRTADVQFSNYCNMACTMCYPDGNPPLQVMPEPLLRQLARDLFPDLAVVEPFVGSEPLVFTWELTRRVAERFAIQLEIVTNAQFLDEPRFRELEPLVSGIRLSVDSHLPDVYAKIRLKSRPDVVFRNLAGAARLCRDHSIEAMVNVVFMAENAPHLDETVAAFADLGIPKINLLQYHYFDERGAASDPCRVLSRTQIDDLLARIRAVAREKRIAVFFDLDPKETVDFRPPDVAYRPNLRNDEWFLRFRRFFPGYCLQSIDRVKVQADGNVYPCCMGGGDQLVLGNLNQKSFEEIWNGPESQDLRRGMLTQDLPSLCRGCSFVSGFLLPEQERMVFLDSFATDERLDFVELPDAPPFELLAPAHLERRESAPTFRWSAPPFRADRLVVELAAGGEVQPINARFELSGDATSFTVPDDAWLRLRGNLGYWWCVFAIDERGRRCARARTARCLVRHQPIPRVVGSDLYHADRALYSFSGFSGAAPSAPRAP